MSDILAGLAAGHLISTDGGAAQRGADSAAADLRLAREEARTVKQKIEAHNWRERAKILSAGRKVRKMSEEILLQALQQENANHPLASGEVIDRIGDLAFEREMDILDADPEAYADEIADRIPISTLLKKRQPSVRPVLCPSISLFWIRCRPTSQPWTKSGAGNWSRRRRIVSFHPCRPGR